MAVKEEITSIHKINPYFVRLQANAKNGYAKEALKLTGKSVWPNTY